MYLSMGPLEISPTNCNFSSKPRTLTWFRLFILCFFPRLTTWSKFQGQRRIFVRPEGSSFGSCDCGMPHYLCSQALSPSRSAEERELENQVAIDQPMPFLTFVNHYDVMTIVFPSQREDGAIWQPLSQPLSYLLPLPLKRPVAFLNDEGGKRERGWRRVRRFEWKTGNFQAKACSVSSFTIRNFEIFFVVLDSLP